jgi:Eukaryotic translation initiation factor 3 subunit 8 N-terminus
VFLKTLQGLEGSVNVALAKEKESKKKMNRANAKALLGMKQKIKFAQKEYETPLKEYYEVFIITRLLMSSGAFEGP